MRPSEDNWLGRAEKIVIKTVVCDRFKTLVHMCGLNVAFITKLYVECLIRKRNI